MLVSARRPKGVKGAVCWLFVASVAAAIPACDSLQSSFVGPEPQHVAASPTHVSSATDWSGERIVVTNANGNVDVVGVAGATRIEVDAYPAALANNQTDADAAIADVAAQIAVTRTADGFGIACPNAASDHGSALTGGTGCARLVVHVPAGSEAMPASLQIVARFGGASVEGISGSVTAEATFDLHASVTPTKDASISLLNGNDGSTLKCPVVLVVPSSFESEGLLVESHHVTGHVATDFSELTVASCDRPQGTLQTIYPGAGPYPCISSAGSHAVGTKRATLIEVLAGDGDAYFVHGAAAAPAWTGGVCNCDGVSLCDPTPRR
jgi:hypothetical protein